jgi:aromatic ring-cleaving dioxygenase
MLRQSICLLALALTPSLLPASDFDWLVREFSRETGARQVHIPFFGLARFVVAVGHPAGTSDLHLAIFERGDFEGLRFRDLTDKAVGPSWKPMIRVRSSKGEYTNIYVREERKHLNLLVTALEGNEATFVQVRVRPEALIRFVDEHDHHH